MTVALSIHDLRKTYPNGFEALNGISLEVQAGDFFALLGPNGAGKSTCIGIISSLVNKTSGKIKVFDTDIDNDFAKAKSYIGLVPQEFNFNIFEPIEEIVINQAGYYGIERNIAVESAEYCLNQLGLWDKRKESARLLSGGMKRRLMIARALVHEPKLLILDEPTAGVDIEIRMSMWKFMRKINEAGTTIILTTHYLEEAENLCRNIAIINNGELVENTTMHSLLAKLQLETFVLNLGSPLKMLPQLPEFQIRQIDDLTLEVDIAHDQLINQLFSLLSSQGVEVLGMRNKSNRLEQLFIGMVGVGNNRNAVNEI